jgi:hypothetical protein
MEKLVGIMGAAEPFNQKPAKTIDKTVHRLAKSPFIRIQNIKFQIKSHQQKRQKWLSQRKLPLPQPDGTRRWGGSASGHAATGCCCCLVSQLV